ncbi:hypothetical protein GCM10023170_009030 [Phytohabitans houttuyneae]|uniref:Uncharacterized protein n=1 Tax=Phytohabitans houttuyneae TaxID=1076126 RepID=A0A6V8KBE7_9ACTN|nr:hypothetical protein Phou_034660 [Phytohabitans houttuyneae]
MAATTSQMALISSPRESASTPQAMAPAMATAVQIAIDLGLGRRPAGAGALGGLVGVVVVTGGLQELTTQQQVGDEHE